VGADSSYLLAAIGVGGVAIAAAWLHWKRTARELRRLRDNAEQGREALRISEARLQEFIVALQNSPNGVVLLDDRGRIEWCNETAARHLRLDATRYLQQPIAAVLPDHAFAEYLASWNYSRDLVLTVPSTAGAPRRVAVQLHAYAGNRRLLLSRDVTSAEQAEAMRRDFVANVSHEIRTPLTVLSGFVETMQTLPLQEDDRNRYLSLMAQQAQRMQALVDDLLVLSRLEGSPLPGTTEWMSAAALQAQCEQDVISLSAAAGKSQQILFTPAPAMEISGAKQELLSAMGNLLGNAVRYTPAQGRIEVAWEPLPQGGAQFSVRDTGPGIAPEHIPRLTERFYRVDRSRSRETGGTGLGLAIVKHVVQRHGGELQIDSRPGEGSTFSIVLPANRVRQAAVITHD
jgi:two-component system, OmpR family, phosphate regulon sensor histidine kinase PhoR